MNKFNQRIIYVGRRYNYVGSTLLTTLDNGTTTLGGGATALDNCKMVDRSWSDRYNKNKVLTHCNLTRSDDTSS